MGACFPPYSLPACLESWHASPFLQPKRFHVSCKHKYSHCRTVFCNFPFPSFRGSIDESPVEWSGQQNPQRSHAAEQMSGEVMQKARILVLWGKHSFAHSHSWAPCLNNTRPSWGLCSPPFAFHLKGEIWSIGSMQEREDLNSYSMSDPLALPWLVSH